MGHVKMMAAVQPFLSGAISKTVNLPHETTVEEIQDIYTQGWKLGLKAVALYRDGCKLSQPLSTKSDSAKSTDTAASASPAAGGQTVSLPSGNVASTAATTLQLSLGPVVPSQSRRKMPGKRRGFTQEATIAGHKIYLRTGEYEDGGLGEIFIDMHKEGAAYRSMMNCFAISVSLGLQYGVPLKEYVDKFTFTRFEPAGFVDGHPNIKMATSIVDYIFRLLGMEYLGRTDFLQVKPETLRERSTEIGEVGPKEPSKWIASSAPVPGVERQLELRPSTGGGALAAASSVGGEQDHLAQMMGDAPPCDQCGHTTVRNGACYKCLNCGNSMGCS